MSEKDPPSISTNEALARGAAIGRYLVLGLVGRGGMGDVYAAYDPELDRKIAVKLLRSGSSSSGQGGSEGRTRLLREAQAIAKLSHTNVVVVFDVGTFEETVFIAMEFIDGDTVRYWLNSGTRTWKDVLKVFQSAGRGLAAAHEAGIVHRDFKPDNVMVGRDGKVRVMDFGLARQVVPGEGAEGADGAGAASGDGEAGKAKARQSGGMSAVEAAGAIATSNGAPPQPAALGEIVIADGDATKVIKPARSTPKENLRLSANLSSSVPSLRALETNLTQTGAMLGTPAYMAPEQFASKATDARTDQFSFCVSLYESLYGERPFAGKNFMALTANVVNGRVKDPPPGTRVPAWVRKILLRGMSPAAENRYPTMEALLDALDKDPSVARRRWALAAGATLAIGALGFGATQTLQARRPPCEGGPAKLAGIWEPGEIVSQRKLAIKAAFMATGKSYAQVMFQTVSRTLDRYTADWASIYKQACEATSVRAEQSAEVLDLRMSCLQGRLDSVKALTDIFGGADGNVVEKAASAANALGDLDRCSDLAILRSIVKPPDDPKVLARVQSLRPRLAQVKALTDAGRLSEALEQARPLAAEARSVGYLPMTAQALRRLGELSWGQPKVAELIVDDAIWAAQAGGDDELMAEGAILQSYIVGYLQGQTTRAWPWTRIADATLHRIGGHEVLRSWLLNNRGALFDIDGRYDESVAAAKQALALKEKALGPDHPDVAMTLGNIANPLAKLGRMEEALDFNARAIRMYEKSVGPDHPDLAMHLSTRAEFLNATLRYADAEAPARRALRIWERELGPQDAFLAFALTAIGRSYLGRDKAAIALSYLQRAHSIRERFDPEPTRLAESAFALAQALWESGTDKRRAIGLANEARRIYEKSPGKDHLAEVTGWLEAHPRATL